MHLRIHGSGWSRTSAAWAALAWVTFGCGPVSERDTAGSVCEAIVGGQGDEVHTAVAALTDDFGQLYCSGTLIAGSVVLTAAHCLDAPIRVATFGDNYLDGVASMRVGSVLAHPDFDRETGEFDVALLMLESAVPEIQPLSVPEPGGDSIRLGMPLAFVGFGDTEEGKSNSRRNTVTGAVNGLTRTTLSYDQAGGGPCNGDSGGPALSTDGGTVRVVGVTSFGRGGCWSGGVSARVQAAADFVAAFVERDRCAP